MPESRHDTSTRSDELAAARLEMREECQRIRFSMVAGRCHCCNEKCWSWISKTGTGIEAEMGGSSYAQPLTYECQRCTEQTA